MRSSTAFASAALIAACSSPSTSSAPSPGSAPEDGSTSSSRLDGSAPSPPSATAMSDASTPLLVPFAPEPKWNDGTKCNAADVETWKLDASTFVLRQSLCTHFEAPFMLLLVGSDKALLVDTGTGDADVVAAVDGALAGKNVELVVAHSHAHGDHVGGDGDFAQRAKTTFRPRTTSLQTTSLDLGGRTVDIVPIPGHEASHVAFYDRSTRVLFTGDTLYPGRLYVRDFAAYRASIARLATFADTHPVSLVLGAHVELASDGDEFTAGAKTHPNEHALSLAESDLRDLHAATSKMTKPARVVGPRWVIVPVQ